MATGVQTVMSSTRKWELRSCLFSGAEQYSDIAAMADQKSSKSMYVP
jgi:hypothetical protein